jgi:hypothetical protein
VEFFLTRRAESIANGAERGIPRYAKSGAKGIGAESKVRGESILGWLSTTLFAAFHLNPLIWANEEHWSSKNWMLSGVPMSTQSSA